MFCPTLQYVSILCNDVQMTLLLCRLMPLLLNKDPTEGMMQTHKQWYKTFSDIISLNIK